MNSISIFRMITGMLSGLTLFIFGMNVMSESLANLAGGKLSRAIDKITHRKMAGWTFGTFLSVFMQSSVTTVMVVGLVSSGLMKVAQSVGIMIGANLGTTATAWLLSLNSLEGSFFLEAIKPASFAPFLGMTGILMLMFVKSDLKREIGKILVGFGVMMIGMNVMGISVEPLQKVPAFNRVMMSFTNPLLGLGVGILCTLAIQSSAAAIGILQALAMSVSVTYAMAIPFVCGAQIGTCLTAILISLSSNNNGRRAALVHLYYNVLRNSVFLLLLYGLNAAFHFPLLNAETGAVGIAMFHTLINIAGSIVFMPLSGLLVRLVYLTIHTSEEEKREEADTLGILDPIFLSNPEFALEQVKTGTTMLSEAVSNLYAAYMTQLSSPGEEDIKKTVRNHSDTVMRYAKQLRDYCVRIAERRLKDKDAARLTFLQSTIDDFAEIGSQTRLLSDKSMLFDSESSGISAEGRQDLMAFGDAVQETLEVTVNDYMLQNTKLAGTIQIYREVITDLNGRINKKHVRRLHRGECRPENNLTFNEICMGYGMIIDRCDSIAAHILRSLSQTVPEISNEQYEKVKKLFVDKYSSIDE